jgi:Mlc titration factor MtfA (ptsG expression regulator)
MLGRLANWWRRRKREPIGDAVWSEVLRRLPWLSGSGAQDLLALREMAERFLRQKDIAAAGGLTLTPQIRAMIAVQACLPVLHLGLAWYRGWYSVIVYPDDFVAPFEYVDEAGIVHSGERELSGEAWPDGPVVLSWHASLGEHGGNLVIHEFAHKLDLLNGDANGLPPLHRGMKVQAWQAAFSAAYDDFCARLDDGEWLAFDAYAAENPGEFFAVLSECFFMDPHSVRAHYPAVYSQLEAFYRPAPAALAGQ